MQWINNSLIHIILNTLQICLKKKSRISLLICLIKGMNVILSSEPWSKGLKLLINCSRLGRCNFLKWMINLSSFKPLHFSIDIITKSLSDLIKEKTFNDYMDYLADVLVTLELKSMDNVKSGGSFEETIKMVE